jgi:preprotein translocase subunit SecF
MNIISKRYLYFLISGIVIIPGLLALLFWGLPLSIDFTGGSLLEISFDAGKMPQPADIVALFAQNGIQDTQVQTTGNNTLSITSKEIDETTKTKLVTAMGTKYNSAINVLQFNTVGPSIGLEVTQGATLAVLAAALVILGYITFAFRGIPHAFRFGTAAIIAMLHDVAVVIGVAALLGHFLGWEVDALFLTALLTVIGFSVHDTIVVFDRIRENENIYRSLSFEAVVNHSVVQTLDRSINTQLTVMMTLFALALFGGLTIRHFVIILLVGVFSGTYSSIFNASPILVVWENKEWRNWFRGSKNKTGVETSN